MFSISLLPAGRGDCLLVEYGTERNLRRLLVDGGPQQSWEQVGAALMRRPEETYDMLVVTHVDEDHVGGAISLLDDPNLKHRVKQVWFNGYVHCKSGGNVLGPVNGEQLTDRIVRGGYGWNKGFSWPTQDVDRYASTGIGGPVVVPTTGSLPSVKLGGGARAVLLSPTGPRLKAMAGVWKSAVAKTGMVEGAGDPGHTQAPKPHHRDVPPLPGPLDRAAVEALAAKQAHDGSVANGSCIAMILEYDGKRLLLGADAHADVLAAGMQRYADQVKEERPRIDVVKLAHHGSNANISPALLDLIDCDRWLISSNGDNYGHPDDAAIAKVITSTGRPVAFSCNYRSYRTEPWAEKGPAVGATFEFPDTARDPLTVDV